MKKLLVVIVCAILSLPVFAQEVDISSEKVLIDGKKFYLHTVKQGQTLYGISKAYNVSTDDIIRINPESSNGVKTGQILKVPFNEVSNNEPVSGNPGKDKETHHVSNPIPEGAITHKVEKKETIYSICKKYNLSVEALYKANPSIQEKGLRAGDVLVIPESDLITDATKPEPEVQKPEPENPKDDSIGFVNHIIVKGETLSAISKKYGVTIAEILKYNPGVSADKIKEGDKLQIPRKPNEQAAFPPEQRNHNGQGGDTLNAKDSRSIEYKIKNEINIIMMLPFEVYVNTKNWYNQELGSKEYTVLPVTEMMLSYYGGCLMAFDSIKQTGLKVNMHVFDTGSDTSSLGSLVNKDTFANADLIIGPVYSKQINYIKDFIPETAVLLSPFSDYEKVDIGDKSVLWANPGKIGRFETLAAFAAKNASNKYIIIYNNDGKSKEDAQELQKMMNESFAMAGKKDSLNVSVLSSSEANGASLGQLLSHSVLNVIICDDKNEAQLSSLMSHLIQIKDVDIQLAGEESWLNYRSIDVNYFQKLRFSYTTPYYIDYTNDKTLRFIIAYRQIFLSEPDEFSFAAYDQMLMFSSLYMKHGGNLADAFNMKVPYCGMVSKNNFVNISGSRQYVQSFSNLLMVDEDFQIKRVYP